MADPLHKDDTLGEKVGAKCVMRLIFRLQDENDL